MKKLLKQLDVVIGHSSVDMEARFEKIRTEETNLSSFYSKMVLFETKADISLLNCGTFRAGRVMPKGDLK
jgi:2',3'-cyclic-nucleotide 2'-phosphodiesterase (5'-nucleotidase family)